MRSYLGDSLLRSSKEAIAIDFDDLLVDGNLSREVIHRLNPELSTRIREAVLCREISRTDALATLRTIPQGQCQECIGRAISAACEGLPWRKGAVPLLKYLASLYRVVIVSAGIGDAIEAKLRLDNIDIRVIAPRLAFCEQICVGQRMQLSDYGKGIVVRRLRQLFRTVWAIGHSPGDRHMLTCASNAVVVRVSPTWSYPAHCHLVNGLEDIPPLLQTGQ